MALIRKKGSPFWWYSFTYAGKRYRKSTGERTRAAAGKVEANALMALGEGLSLPKKSAKTPTLREFSERFRNWSDIATLEGRRLSGSIVMAFGSCSSPAWRIYPWI